MLTGTICAFKDGEDRTKEQAKSYFSECGEIREIRKEELSGYHVVTIEFYDSRSCVNAFKKYKADQHSESSWTYINFRYNSRREQNEDIKYRKGFGPCPEISRVLPTRARENMVSHRPGPGGPGANRDGGGGGVGGPGGYRSRGGGGGGGGGGPGGPGGDQRMGGLGNMMGTNPAGANAAAAAAMASMAGMQGMIQPNGFGQMPYGFTPEMFSLFNNQQAMQALMGQLQQMPQMMQMPGMQFMNNLPSGSAMAAAAAQQQQQQQQQQQPPPPF